MKNDIVSQLNQAYDAEIKNVSLLGGRSNEVRLVETDRGTYVCKLYPLDSNLTRIHELIQFLDEKGFPVVSPLTTSDNLTTFRADDRVGALMPYVSGSDFSGQLVEVRSAGRALGDFHRLSSEFATPEITVDFEKELTNYVETIRSHGTDSVAGTGLSDGDLAEMATAAERCRERLSGHTPPQEARLYIHGDYNDQNVLFDNNGSVVLVADWEDAGPGLTYTDLAKGANKFAITDLEYDTSQINPEKVAEFVEAYDHVVNVSPDLLVGLLERNALSSVAWGLKNYAKHGDDLFREVLEWYAANLDSITEVTPELKAALR